MTTEVSDLSKLLERVRALEVLAEQQGWVLKSDGEWRTKAFIENRRRMEQICIGCKQKEKDCECAVCFSCGGKNCRGDCLN